MKLYTPQTITKLKEIYTDTENGKGMRLSTYTIRELDRIYAKIYWRLTGIHEGGLLFGLDQRTAYISNPHLTSALYGILKENGKRVFGPHPAI